MVRKRTIATVGAVVVAAGVLNRSTSARRACRALGVSTTRRARYLRGRLRGVEYRVRGRHPALDVADVVLADRVRSELGPLGKQLDLPHIHVMVHSHVAMLHGDVADEVDRESIETAVSDVVGVRGVESYLHVGLLASDTRPSEGRAQPPPRSAALRRLEAAAERAGSSGSPATAVRGVLGSFCDRVPIGERSHLFAHLPADVRALAYPPRRLGAAAPHIRTVADLAEAVPGVDGHLDLVRAEQVTEAVLRELSLLVPEERADVGAVLPRDLRELWARVSSSARTSEEALDRA